MYNRAKRSSSSFFFFFLLHYRSQSSPKNRSVLYGLFLCAIAKPIGIAELNSSFHVNYHIATRWCRRDFRYIYDVILLLPLFTLLCILRTVRTDFSIYCGLLYYKWNLIYDMCCWFLVTHQRRYKIVRKKNDKKRSKSFRLLIRWNYVVAVIIFLYT